MKKMYDCLNRFIVGRMWAVGNKQEVEKMDERQAGLLAGRQEDEHTGWIAGRYWEGTSNTKSI